MVAEIAELVENYRRWLGKKTRVTELNDTWIEITTPFIDRHNDLVQLFARREGAGYLLTDDAATIDDLEASGCNMDTPKRQELLRLTLNGFNVKSHGRALQVNATPDNFSARKHDLLQAILAVNDMFYLAQPMVESLFVEDVSHWLEASNIRFTPQVKFAGRSGYDYRFNFVIPKSRAQPERIVEAINRPTKDTAADLIFRWTDTRNHRAADAQAFAILNDREQSVSSAVLDALAAYNIEPVRWSARLDVQERLAA